jgi:hypothetical protein
MLHENGFDFFTVAQRENDFCRLTVAGAFFDNGTNRRKRNAGLVETLAQFFRQRRRVGRFLEQFFDGSTIQLLEPVPFEIERRRELVYAGETGACG